MKRSTFLILAFLAVLACRNRQDPALLGSWTTPIPGMEPFRYGFTLNADGSAASINSATLQYKKWTTKGNILVLEGESIGNRASSTVSDSFRLVKDAGGKTTLQTADGRSLEMTDTATVAGLVKDHNTSYCFSNTQTPDVAELSYRRSGNVIIGSLAYQISGKDRNFGTLKGTISGDTLSADYTFSSEGTESIREVVMLRKGEGWQEGVGEVVVEGNKARFKDKSAISFKGFALDRKDCQ